MRPVLISSAACFGGEQRVYSHTSAQLGCEVRFAVYLPPQALAEEGPLLPALWFLSGLTCTEQNVITKAGAQRYAAEHGLILICPDTSPRGESVADDEGWDLGQGAGFYVDATEQPWADHYRMYSYVVHELPDVVAALAPVDLSRQGITGHSMGGHGALTIALKNPGRYRSVSAFAPICAPVDVPWGEKAFSAYLGPDRSLWAAHDASRLIAGAEERLPILVDQGESDGFLEGQLKPEALEAAAAAADHPLTLRRHPGYDHSYYFIASFIGDHFAHHAAALNG